MNQYKKVAFYTLGCKLNFSETSTIARNFKDGGYAKVNFEDNPDVLVINTCSVTENADKKCKQLVKKALKVNPDAYIAVIGCYAQLKPEEISAIPGVDIVLGANEKFNILEHVEKIQAKKALDEIGDVEAVAIKHTKDFVPSYSFGDRTRTFLKVQDGCDYFCSFCTIPLARGRSRSNSVAETIKVAKEAALNGAKEIVLTGVNIGDFGTGTDETLLDLIKELENIEGVERYRISSIEPNLLNKEIINFVAKSKKFVPHFHIPLQSGSPSILKAMRRRYERETYTKRVKLIKELMPECSIGVDVIIGFPGEGEQEFQETYDYLHEIDVSYFHVFTYSERDNTTAVRVKEGVVSSEDRKKRSVMLHILSDKKRRKFYQDNVGKQYQVLFEQEEDEGIMYGFTENYIKVKTPFQKELSNAIKTVSLDEIDRDGVFKISILN